MKFLKELFTGKSKQEIELMKTIYKAHQETELKRLQGPGLSGIDFAALEISRLKMVEAEHKRLLSLIRIWTEKNDQSGDIRIIITRFDQAYGKDWEEIVRLALDNEVK